MPTAFEESLAQAGTRVRMRHDPALVGECTGRVQDDGDGLIAHVRFPGQQPKFEMAEDLEAAEAVLDEESQIREGRYARASHLRKRLTAVQLGGQLSELIYSLDTTDTEFMPHQFKPLLALLDSPSKGLLIADEVGLGKTIEAGLIWTELRFRTNAPSHIPGPDQAVVGLIRGSWFADVFARVLAHVTPMFVTADDTNVCAFRTNNAVMPRRAEGMA